MAALTSFDSYIAAAKEEITFFKTASTTSTAALPFSIFDLAGSPSAGTLAGANTANGVVPTDATAGFPPISAFSGTNGWLTRVEYAGSVAGRSKLYDCLFKAGAYAFNAAVALTAQPSYSSRVPGGTNYAGLEIWIETVTAFTGTPSFAITYTNQAGTAGRTTGTVSAGGALSLKRMFRLPLQAGDTGVQKIESVTCTVATVGTFNVLVLRPLCGPFRVRAANDGDVYGIDRAGIEEVYTDSALYVVAYPDSTSTGTPDYVFEITNL